MAPTIFDLMIIGDYSLHEQLNQYHDISSYDVIIFHLLVTCLGQMILMLISSCLGFEDESALVRLLPLVCLGLGFPA